MKELYRQSLVRNDKIFFSVQRISNCFPTFLLIFVMCFPKFRELSNVNSNGSTISNRGSVAPSASNDSLTLSFSRENQGLEFLRVQDHLVITKPLTHHYKFLINKTCSTTAASESAKYS